MQTFISKIIDRIAEKHTAFNDVVFILPSQRAKVFVKQALKTKISLGFLPDIKNIEEFVGDISGIKKADFVELLFHLYAIYKKQEEKPDSFEVFSSWALTVLQDFNEIDQHLINSNEIFAYIRDIQRLRKWSVKGTFQETDLMKDHYKFLEKLSDLYNAFYKFLVDNQMGYQGVLYREAVKKLPDYLSKNTAKHFYFIGFNALNASESHIFQEMLSEGNTNVFWDIDSYFLKSNHQAGSFIRNYVANWKYYQQNEMQLVSDCFMNHKNIQVIGASKNITQIKHVGELLSDIPPSNSTVLVLADENLLPVTLHSLPQHIDKVNITMGYALKDVPATQFIFLIMHLFLSQERFQKVTANLFYYKDVINFCKHPLFLSLFNGETTSHTPAIYDDISKNNDTFVSADFIRNFFDGASPEIKEISRLIFDCYKGVDDFTSRVLEVISMLKNKTSPLEKEFLFRYFTIFKQIQNLQQHFGFISDLKTLHHFFKQLVRAESISFQGEPLEGLQIMGMLETRVLDFENVIITSVNEGVLPTNSEQQSFIPLDVKTDFGLPTYREKDAIFSYHFFRLLQRAKNVYLLYNTEPDSMGKGEKSRLIMQLGLLHTIDEQTVSPEVVINEHIPKKVAKTDAILTKLKDVAQNGLSPSALTNYLYNPIQFYQQKVLDIRELEQVEETIAMNTLGTVVHNALETFYKPFIGSCLTVTAIDDMIKEIKPVVKKHFVAEFKNGNISTGKNRLIFEVATRYVLNFLKQEKELLEDPTTVLKIIATEQNLEATLTFDELDFPITIRGQVDRIDELNGVTRIIDYKTGIVKEPDLKIVDFEEITDYTYHKAIQVLLYAYLYIQNNPSTNPDKLQAGIVSFKNLKKGFLSLNFSEKRGEKDGRITEDRLLAFMNAIKKLILEIYDKNTPFVAPEDVLY